MNQKLIEKITESLSSVLPVTCIVLILGITIAPIPLDPLMLFLAGAAFLIIGMGFFTLGVDMAMMPIGEKVGAQLAQAKRLPVIIVACIIIGAVVTVAEPDLQVLAGQTPAVPDMVLILAVAAGVGFFLAVAFLRSLFGWSLSHILMVCYIILFIMAFYIPGDFLAVAFDSGGVTTGPITVPFIIALGMGLSSIGQGKNQDSDSFGLVALCSIGPILSVMILGLVYQSSSGTYEPMSIPSISNSQDLWLAFQHELPEYGLEVFTALFPILAFYILFQLFFLKMRPRQVVKILVGMLYSYIGLTLFLTGVNVGFMPAGSYLGKQLASLPYRWIIVPVAMLIGYFIVKAEPAVQVLNKQVADMTGGTISETAMMKGLSIGMALSLGFSLFRVLTGLPLLSMLLPGYAIALLLSFIVPPVFTSIAFDSGGVASGPMTATFLLPFAMGACEALGGDILKDAFGIVAMVAMTPLIIIQLIGLSYEVKTRREKRSAQLSFIDMDSEFINLEKEDPNES